MLASRPPAILAAAGCDRHNVATSRLLLRIFSSLPSSQSRLKVAVFAHIPRDKWVTADTSPTSTLPSIDRDRNPTEIITKRTPLVATTTSPNVHLILHPVYDSVIGSRHVSSRLRGSCSTPTTSTHTQHTESHTVHHLQRTKPTFDSLQHTE